MLASLHRSKHLWCLKRCKEASIDRKGDDQQEIEGEEASKRYKAR
jgi:hypothetical protein